LDALYQQNGTADAFENEAQTFWKNSLWMWHLFILL